MGEGHNLRFRQYEELHYPIYFRCGGLDLMPATH